MVAKAKKQLEEGKDLINATIPGTVGVLRYQTVGWQQATYNFCIANQAIVRHSWERCVAEGWNLGYQCLTSEKAQVALSKQLEVTDSSFNCKLTLRTEREEDVNAMDSHMEGQEHKGDVNIPTRLLAAVHLNDPTALKEIEIGKDGAVELKLAEIEDKWTDQENAFWESRSQNCSNIGDLPNPDWPMSNSYNLGKRRRRTRSQ